MKIEKAHWVNDNDTLRLSMPIMKVDQQKRIVSGFASLDNVDKHGDIVTADASRKAFEVFGGNLREMHQAIAAGRVLSFSTEPFYDAETDKTYQGIFVNAYVSQGAESTWLKVLDGTLTGFSIGAKLKEDGAKTVYDAALDATVRVITDIELIELSLVDTPANQYAKIVSIQKLEDGIEANGIAVGVKTSSVFWCKNDQYAQTADAETASCLYCGGQMENIGWVEVGDSGVEKMRDLVKNYKASSDDQTGHNALESEGGVEKMADEVKDETAAPVEEVVEKDDTPTETVVETPAVDEGVDVLKALEDFKTYVSEAVDRVSTETQKSFSEGIETVTKAFEDHRAAVDAELKALRDEFAGVSEKFNSATGDVEEVKKRLGAVEDETATKKAGEQASEPVIEKTESVWNGAFSISTLTS